MRIARSIDQAFRPQSRGFPCLAAYKLDTKQIAFVIADMKGCANHSPHGRKESAFEWFKRRMSIDEVS